MAVPAVEKRSQPLQSCIKPRNRQDTHASVPQSATELNFYAASSPGPDSYQTTSSHNIGALAQSGIQKDDGFSGSLLYLAAQDGLDDGETKCVHKYC